MVDPLQVKNWRDYIRASAKTAAVLQELLQRQPLFAVSGPAFGFGRSFISVSDCY
jgi:uncharacterized protein (DUF934 family)